MFGFDNYNNGGSVGNFVFNLSAGGRLTRAADAGVAVVEAVAAVVAVNGEDGVKWRQWGGRSMAESAAR